MDILQRERGKHVSSPFVRGAVFLEIPDGFTVKWNLQELTLNT